jgi:serine phosphatase RsbU (regulator of sigma subunit)
MYRKNFDNPLVLYTQRFAVDALAESWLELGSQAFGIWGDHLLACWPASARENLIAAEEAEALVSAPIMLDDQVIGKVAVLGLGILGAARKVRLHADALLLSQIMTLMTKFEDAATELISQAQLKNEIDMAANIQLQLLPQSFPAVKGLDIYASSSPATQVGGDFYDFSASKGRPFVFAIGDISGKGLPAALFMAMTRIVLHAAARFIPTVDPKAILFRVSEDLYDDFTEVGMFATIFVACYDAQAKQIVYANAGHSPVIYCPAGGKARLLQADSTAVGVLPENTCHNYSIPFHTNDILLAATDGLNECINLDGEMFGYERLLNAVESLAHLSSHQIGSKILETINQFAAGYVQFDDQTLILVKGVE